MQGPAPGPRRPHMGVEVAYALLMLVGNVETERNESGTLVAPAKYVGAPGCPNSCEKQTASQFIPPASSAACVPGDQSRQLRRCLPAWESSAGPPVGAECIGENRPGAVVIVAAVPVQRHARRLPLLPGSGTVAPPRRYVRRRPARGNRPSGCPSSAVNRNDQSPVRCKRGRRRAEAGLRAVFSPLHAARAPICRLRLRLCPGPPRYRRPPPHARFAPRSSAVTAGLPPGGRSTRTVPWLASIVSRTVVLSSVQAKRCQGNTSPLQQFPDLRFAAHT